jgi:hypothetical protein
MLLFWQALFLCANCTALIRFAIRVLPNSPDYPQFAAGFNHPGISKS